jgi:hypothetical protein
LRDAEGRCGERQSGDRPASNNVDPGNNEINGGRRPQHCDMPSTYDSRVTTVEDHFYVATTYEESNKLKT